MSIRELIASLLCETNIDEEVTASHILKAYGIPDRKVGKWIWSEEEWAYTCSACGTKFDYDKTYEIFDHGFQFADYCPSCGAKMKGEDE